MEAKENVQILSLSERQRKGILSAISRIKTVQEDQKKLINDMIRQVRMFNSDSL